MTNLYRIVLGGLVCLVLAVSPASAAVDMILQVPGVDGESIYSGFEDDIDVLAWSWGASTPGCGGGSFNVQNISLTKWFDLSSTDLWAAMEAGTVYPTVTLRVFKAGANPGEMQKIIFSNAVVTSVSTGGSGGEDRLTENVTLGFSQAAITYNLLDSGGKATQTNTTTITAGTCP